MTADVRVVVVTYNSEGFLGPFLDSVAESSQREIAITVSDNGSRDGSLAIAEGRPGVTVLRNGANLGNRLNGSHFIVGEHYADQYRFGLDRRFNSFRIHSAEFIDRKYGHFKTFFF